MCSSDDFIPIEKYKDLEQKYNQLKFELDDLKRLIFGKKSERHTPEKNYVQSSFDLPGLSENLSPDSPTQTKTVTYQKTIKQKSKLPNGIEVNTQLPVQQVYLEPEGDLREFKKVRDEVTRFLEYEAPKIYWVEYIRSVYAPKDGIGSFLTPTLPFRPIQKGLPGPSFATQIVVDKFVDHCPVHRQLKKYARMGVKIPDSTADGWVGKFADLLEPLYECAKIEVLEQKYLQADETTIKVLKQSTSKNGAPHLGYMVPCHSPIAKMAFFEYIPRRNQEAQNSLLSAFSGYLQTDGHNCYNKVAKRKDVIHVGCMYHARRKFEKALATNKKYAEFALKAFRLLSEIERKCIDPVTGLIDFSKRKKLRQRFSKQIMQILKSWFSKVILTEKPKSLISKAIAYTSNRWSELTVFIENEQIEISNNLIENLIRPFAVGRKNWLFGGSPNGAKRAAIFFTLISGCHLNKVDPFAYLKDVVLKISDHPQNKLHELLPWRWKPPEKTT